jgi:pantoate--beta-alanine ligase
MKTLRTIAGIREALQPFHADPLCRLGLVPTMGALHAGHAALFHAARADCDAVVATIFVNPPQFGDPRDLSTYPRNEAADAALAERAGVDVLFAPGVEDMYPTGFATWVDVEGAAVGFEGESRPGHFRAVATVCLKLFAIVSPAVAFFGQKDAQQVAVIQQMVRDLNLSLEIRVIPTVRDADHLALSSRNVRLTPEDRVTARAIPRALQAGLAAYHAGHDPIAAARAMLTGLEPEYVAVASFNGRPTLVIAARVGAARLIDNVPLDQTRLEPANDTSAILEEEHR